MKKLKTRRVGTISMAIILIAFGVLIFIAQINSLSAVELAVKFWPMILILLGGEILWVSFKEKKENESFLIRYDIFSMFIVMVVLFVNICIYGLVETGIMDYIKIKVSDAGAYRYETDLE